MKISKKRKQHSFIDLTGEMFNYLTVIKRDYSDKPTRNIYYFCQCICGTVKSIVVNKIKSGSTKSCGCKKYEWRNRRPDIAMK